MQLHVDRVAAAVTVWQDVHSYHTQEEAKCVQLCSMTAQYNTASSWHFRRKHSLRVAV